MVIQCPKCGSRYNLDPKFLEPAGRQLRCTKCKAVFFQPLRGPAYLPAPEPPVTAVSPDSPAHRGGGGDEDAPTVLLPDQQVQVERRRQDRMFLQAKAELRLYQGVAFHGTTQDLNDEGVTFLPAGETSLVNIGDLGDFSFILEGASKEYFTELPCQVIHVDEGAIGIRFLSAEETPVAPDTVSRRPDTLKESDFKLVAPGAQVAVRRHGGEFEHGWVVLPREAKLPPNIQETYERKSQEGTCVVCRKPGQKGSGQDMYKVYFTLDLLAIQMACRSQ